MLLGNLSVARKLGAGFGSVLLVVLIGFTTVFYQAHRLVGIERLNSDSDAADRNRFDQGGFHRGAHGQAALHDDRR